MDPGLREGLCKDEAACILLPLPKKKQSSIDLGHINTGDWKDLYLVLPKGVVSLTWCREEGGCPAEGGSRRVSLQAKFSLINRFA